MGNRIFFIILVIVVTMGYAAYQAIILEDKLASSQVVKSESVISKLPDVSFEKFFESGAVNIASDFPQKNLVIHFWATWCGPCEAEFPKFEKLLKTMDMKNTVFIFVTVNDVHEKVVKFLSKFPTVSSKVVLVKDDISTFQKYFGTYKLPETYVFGRDKSILRKFTGPQDWDNTYFTKFFTPLM